MGRLHWPRLRAWPSDSALEHVGPLAVSDFERRRLDVLREKSSAESIERQAAALIATACCSRRSSGQGRATRPNVAV
jgi:hypothetical protein